MSSYTPHLDLSERLFKAGATFTCAHEHTSKNHLNLLTKSLLWSRPFENPLIQCCMHVSPAFETLSACLSLASGGDEEKVCFYLKVLHSWRACKRCSCRAVSCMYVCLLVLICVRAWFCVFCTGSVFVWLHVCLCACTYVHAHFCASQPLPGEACIVLSRTAWLREQLSAPR